jgi:hypothetical protein
MSSVDAGFWGPSAKSVLDRRLQLRLLAVIAWTGFLGAGPILLVWMAASPAAAEPDLGRVSLAFFSAWFCAVIPAAMATVLVSPLFRQA